MGVLSNNEMAQAIQRGGSVIFNGRHINRIEDLPNDAQIAAVMGDPAREAAAVAALQQQVAAMQAQLDEAQAAQARRAAGGQSSIELAPDVAERLAAAGYDTPDKIAQATDEQLLAVDGIGQATVKRLRATVVKTK